MDLARRRAARLAVAALIASLFVSAAVATAGNRREPLSGTWAGQIAGQPNSGVRGARLVIVVNGRETGGSWRLSAACRGPLVLDSISNGYHHYLRKLAPGATCAGGDVDCLRRVGATLYDAVTSHLGGAYDLSGTLRRVRSP